MKKKIKLKDLTKEQWDKNRDSLCKFQIMHSCSECIFKWVNCFESNYTYSWVNYKDIQSDEFLNQEVEIETPDILDEVEKEYLSAVIKPFRNRIINIGKFETMYGSFEYISIEFKGAEVILLPRFKANTMYKGMERNKRYTLDELGLFQSKYKITLTEFWSSKEKSAIHCDTEEKANKLLKAFDKMGKKWNARESYLGINRWGGYKENTCYSNTHGYCYINWFKKNGYKIYEFKDVDFEGLEND